jgi:hypothetical protein
LYYAHFRRYKTAVLYRQVSFYANVVFLKNAAQTEHKIPVHNGVFPGVRD